MDRLLADMDRAKDKPELLEKATKDENKDNPTYVIEFSRFDQNTGAKRSPEKYIVSKSDIDREISILQGKIDKLKNLENSLKG